MKVEQNIKAEKIHSIVKKGSLKEDEIIDFIKEQTNKNVYMVTDYGVFLGKVKKNKIVLEEEMPPPEFIQEVRLFSKESEVKITRVKQDFVWRERKEKKEGNVQIDYFDECHKLWGKIKEFEGVFSVLREKRGTEIRIPRKREHEVGQEIGLIFRKYIAFQDKDFATNQPFSYQIIDERLVEYRQFKGGFSKC